MATYESKVSGLTTPNLADATASDAGVIGLNAGFAATDAQHGLVKVPKTQVKRLTVSTGGNNVYFAELQFTGLTIGQKYIVELQAAFFFAVATDALGYMRVYNDNNATNNLVLEQFHSGTGGHYKTINNSDHFTAVSTHLSVYITSTQNTYFPSNTFLRVTEDHTVDTTDFT